MYIEQECTIVRHLALLYQNTTQNELASHQKSIDKIIDVNRSISQQVCNSCKSSSVIFGEFNGETVCTDCGIIILEKQMTLEKRIESKDMTGMPSSLVYPDKGLTTAITNQNTDAYGTWLNQVFYRVVLNSLSYHKIKKFRFWPGVMAEELNWTLLLMPDLKLRNDKDHFHCRAQ